MIELLRSPESWIALATLSVLETVLGIDNVIFLAIQVGRLPPARRRSARVVGLGLAMITRIALLFSIVWLIKLTAPWFHVLGQPISGRDLILGVGGAFLIFKSAAEIRHMLAGVGADQPQHVRLRSSFMAVVVQIALIDIVFSLDSVFTAVGLARPDQVPIMVAAIVLSIIVMLWLSGPIARFVDRHPTVKVLALAFLVLIGISLVAESVELHIPKGYLYFAMVFSFGVEAINLRLRRDPHA